MIDKQFTFKIKWKKYISHKLMIEMSSKNGWSSVNSLEYLSRLLNFMTSWVS